MGGGGSGDPLVLDGGVMVDSSPLSSSRKITAHSPVSVAILPSCNGWPGSQPMTTQSLHLGWPTCSLSLCSTKLPPAVIPVANSQSCPLSRCHAGQMLALSQAGVLPVSRSPPDSSFPISPVSTLLPSAFPSLPLSLPQTAKTCGFCQGHIEIKKSPSSTLGYPLFCKDEL